MTRTYAREEIRWDISSLQALAALEPPQATYFEKADRWVVKQDGKSFAVRPEQIDDAQYDDYDGFDPDAAYERYLENGGPHAEAIAAEDAIEREREANDIGLQQMRAERAKLDAEEAAAVDLVQQLLAATQDAREAEKPAVVVPAPVVALNAELDDLLAHFT